MAIFTLCFITQIGISLYRSVFIFEPINTQLGNIQHISALLDCFEDWREKDSAFRWDYGSTRDFGTSNAESSTNATKLMEKVAQNSQGLSREMSMQTRALHIVYGRFLDYHQELAALLDANEIEKGKALYYGKIADSENVLVSYTQNLLGQAISDNQGNYDLIMVKNGQMQVISSFSSLITLCVGLLFAIVLLSFLHAINDVAKQSIAISQGRYDLPDLVSKAQSELGQMIRAFNGMKHAMAQQVALLVENNRMEKELGKKERETITLHALVESEKLQMLRSQINPHFLFNTLNVIVISAIEEGAKETQALLESLCLLYRYALGNNSINVPLAKEIQVVNALFSLYSARFGDRIALVWDISPAIDIRHTSIPSFLLQPLVENAQKHGLAKQKRKGVITIEMRTDAEILRITIKDNGVGMPSSKLEEIREILKRKDMPKTNIGMYNVSARLKLFDPDSLFNLTSEEGVGTVITLTLPLKKTSEGEEPCSEY